MLISSLAQPHRITVGRLGEFLFPRGWYAYVGSAQRGVGQRVRRHLNNGKTAHWHIDCLKRRACRLEAWVLPWARNECALASAIATGLQTLPWPRAFGSSDCRCGGHLIPGGGSPDPLLALLCRLGLSPFLSL